MSINLLKGLAITMGGGLAFGVGMKMGQGSARQDKSASPAPDLTPLQRRLDQFEQQVKQLPKTDLTPLQRRLEQFEQQIQHLPKPDLAPLQRRLEQFEQQVQQMPAPDWTPLQRRLDEFEKQVRQIPTPDLTPVQRRLDQFEKQLQQRPAADLTPIEKRLDQFEQQVKQIEKQALSNGPGAMRAGGLDRSLLDDSIAALEKKLAERTEALRERSEAIDHRVATVEKALGSQIHTAEHRISSVQEKLDQLAGALAQSTAALRGEIEAVETRGKETSGRLSTRIAELELNLSSEIDTAVGARIETLQSELQKEFKDAQGRTVDAFVETIETKVVNRISSLETNLLEHSEAVVGLRDKSLRTDANMQKLLRAVEQLCEQTTRQVQETLDRSKPAETAEAPKPSRFAIEEAEAPELPAHASPLQQAVAATALDPAEEDLMFDPEVIAEYSASTKTHKDEEPLPAAEDSDAEEMDLVTTASRPERKWRIPLAFSVATVSAGLVGMEATGALTPSLQADPLLARTPIEQLAPPALTAERRLDDAAFAALRGRAGENPEDAAAQLAFVKQLGLRGNWAEAERLARSLADADNASRDSIFALSEALFQQKRFAESAAALNRLSVLR